MVGFRTSTVTSSQPCPFIHPTPAPTHCFSHPTLLSCHPHRLSAPALAHKVALTGVCTRALPGEYGHPEDNSRDSNVGTSWAGSLSFPTAYHSSMTTSSSRTNTCLVDHTSAYHLTLHLPPISGRPSAPSSFPSSSCPPVRHVHSIQWGELGAPSTLSQPLPHGRPSGRLCARALATPVPTKPSLPPSLVSCRLLFLQFHLLHPHSANRAATFALTTDRTHTCSPTRSDVQRPAPSAS